MFPFTKILRKIKRFIDLQHDTHTDIPQFSIQRSIIQANKLDINGLDNHVVEYLCDQYFHHRFDLLGSGWMENSYSSNAPGLGEYKYDHTITIEQFDSKGNWLDKILHKNHLKESRHIWQKIIPPYTPIDWQKDIKSGFRWNAKNWYKEQRKKYYPGADLKVPWEISRFYHLVQLAVFSLSEPKNKKRSLCEFHNQILDFIATNPPRMGVNWTTTMEVSIRVVNMLVAYDLFMQLDDTGILDDFFQSVFARSIYEHGLHIFHNLENTGPVKSNHYLSNLTGLLFIGAYLPITRQTIKWVEFSIRELGKEMDKQFLPDGVNFESSTAYHSLSASFILYSTALILGVFAEHRKFPEFVFLEKVINETFGSTMFQFYTDGKSFADSPIAIALYKMGNFTRIITKPNFQIPQIGDNDSGRLIKLTPVGKFMTSVDAQKKYIHLRNNELPDEKYWDENILDHTPLLAAFNGMFHLDEFNIFGTRHPLEKSFIESLANQKHITAIKINENQKDIHFWKNPKDLRFSYHKEYELFPAQNNPVSLKNNLKLYPFFFANFFVFRSDRLYLAVNAMSNGQDGNGGHAHNDKLSFELSFDGEDVIVDPGTYLYTPLPEERNRFRSTPFHNTLIIPEKEQNRWDEGISGLFHLSNDAQCEVVFLQKDTIGLTLSYQNIKQMRIIEILDDRIRIRDFCNFPFYSYFNYFDNYSNGYGKLIRYNIKNGDKI